MNLEIRYYQTSAGKKPFVRWLANLKEPQARAKVRARLARVAIGNLGDLRSMGNGVIELRIDSGPGYRVYFARRGNFVILLLCAGDKRTQQRDIERAKAYLEDYETRLRTQAPRNGT
jgi:putative addiction module killer protein